MDRFSQVHADVDGIRTTSYELILGAVFNFQDFMKFMK